MCCIILFSLPPLRNTVMAAPKHLAILEKYGITMDSVDPATGLLNRWYNNLMSCLLKSKDINVFEESDKFCLYFGRPAGSVMSIHYEELNIPKESMNVMCFTFLMGFVGAMKQSGGGDVGDTERSVKFPVWACIDLQREKDYFCGFPAYVYNTKIPNFSPHVLYAILGRNRKSSISTGILDNHLPSHIDFVNYMIIGVDVEMCTFESVITHMKDFFLDSESPQSLIFKNELENSTDPQIKHIVQSPRMKITPDHFCTIFNKTFLKYRLMYLDCGSFYLRSPVTGIIEKILGVNVADRLREEQIDIILKDLKNNVCGVTSFQYMIALLRRACVNLSSSASLLIAYENHFRNFEKFNEASWIWFSMYKDLTNFETAEGDTSLLNTHEKREGLVACNHMLESMEHFRREMFYYERYCYGNVPDIDSDTYFMKGATTNMPKKIYDHYKASKIYSFCDTTTGYLRTEAAVPRSWVDAVHNIYIALYLMCKTAPQIKAFKKPHWRYSDHVEDLLFAKPELWDCPFALSKSDVILDRLSTLDVDLNTTLFVLPNAVQSESFSKACGMRVRCVEAQHAIDHFRGAAEIVTMDGLDKFKNKMNHMILIGVDWMSCLDIDDILNQFYDLVIARTELTRLNSVILVMDSECCSRMIPTCSFTRLFTAFLESTSDDEVVNVVPKFDFESEESLETTYTYTIPSRLRDYFTRFSQEDALALFSNSFKWLSNEEREKIYKALGDEWEGHITDIKDRKIRVAEHYHIEDTGEIVFVKSILKGLFQSVFMTGINKYEQVNGVYGDVKTVVARCLNASYAKHFPCCYVKAAKEIRFLPDDKIDSLQALPIKSTPFIDELRKIKNAGQTDIRFAYHNVSPLSSLNVRSYFGPAYENVFLICPVIDGDDKIKITWPDVALASRACFKKLTVVIVLVGADFDTRSNIMKSPAQSFAPTRPFVSTSNAWQWIKKTISVYNEAILNGVPNTTQAEEENIDDPTAEDNEFIDDSMEVDEESDIESLM